MEAGHAVCSHGGGRGGRMVLGSQEGISEAYGGLLFLIIIIFNE